MNNDNSITGAHVLLWLRKMGEREIQQTFKTVSGGYARPAVGEFSAIRNQLENPNPP